MSNTISRDEIGEFTAWEWDCPDCHHYNQTFEDPDDTEVYLCHGCKKCIRIVQD